MRAEVEKSDSEVYSELEICRAIKIGHGLKAMKLARTEFESRTKRSVWIGRQARPMWHVKPMDGPRAVTVRIKPRCNRRED